jgi:hypothetical protein
MDDATRAGAGTRRSNGAIALSIIGSGLAGVIAMLAVIPAWFARDWTAVGVLAGAAGLSFGLLANALLRQ